MMLVVLPAPGWALNRAVLVRELQLPRIALNLDVTFSTSDLRIPISEDPAADIEKAREELKAGDRPDLHLRLAKLHAALDQYEEMSSQYQAALDGYEALLKQEPGNARAHCEYAEALIAVGADTEAAVHIEDALIADETLWEAHELSADLHAKHSVLAYQQGMMGLTQGHLAAAEAEAEEAIRLAPERPDPYVMLFMTRWLPAVLALREGPASGLDRLGEFEAMSEVLKKAAARAPTYQKLRLFAIACNLTPFFTAQMVKGLDKGVWEDLDEPQRRVLTSARVDLLALGLEIPELKAECLLFAGIASFMMADRDGLHENLRASADAAPEGTSALEAMVGFLTHEEKWAEALVVAEEIKQRHPSGKAHAWVGRICAEQKKWKPAEEAFRVATTYDDAIDIANLGLGVVLLKRGADPLEALMPLRTAWEHGQGQPDILLAWGVVLALVGEVDEGRRYVARALMMLPDSPGRDALAREFGIRTAR